MRAHTLHSFGLGRRPVCVIHLLPAVLVLAVADQYIGRRDRCVQHHRAASAREVCAGARCCASWRLRRVGGCRSCDERVRGVVRRGGTARGAVSVWGGVFGRVVLCCCGWGPAPLRGALGFGGVVRGFRCAQPTAIDRHRVAMRGWLVPLAREGVGVVGPDAGASGNRRSPRCGGEARCMGSGDVTCAANGREDREVRMLRACENPLPLRGRRERAVCFPWVALRSPLKRLRRFVGGLRFTEWLRACAPLGP